MKFYKIKDSVHGMIKFYELEKRVIDSKAFQRLRKIKQLSLAYLAYPGATHTRLEHSLGVMHLSSKLAKTLELDVKLARIAGLIHDIGHVAFSHLGEEVIKQRERINHEELGEKIVKEHLSFLLENYTKKELFSSNEARVVSFSLGSDRLDYLKRDSYYTGVGYGVIEDDVISLSLKRKGKQFYLKYAALEAAESLFIGRFMMFFAVLLHKTVRIATSMLGKALENAYKNNEISTQELIWDGDEVVLYKVLSTSQRDLAKRIVERRLYKKVCFLKPTKENLKISKEVEKYGAIVSYPKKVGKGYDVKVIKEGKAYPIEELSVLTKSLKESEQSKYHILIAAKESKVKEIKRIVERLGRR